MDAADQKRTCRFCCCSFPVQVGPPTQYARSRRLHLLILLLVQTVISLVKLSVELWPFSGILHVLMVIFGFFAYYHDMNISYICIYGLVAWITCLLQTIFFIIALVVRGWPYPVLESFVRAFVILSAFCGGVFSYWMWEDYVGQEVVGPMVGGRDESRDVKAPLLSDRGTFYGAGPPEPGVLPYGSNTQPAPAPAPAPRNYAPRDYAPGDYAPRDYERRDYAPHDYAPRDYAPPDSASSDYRFGGKQVRVGRRNPFLTVGSSQMLQP